MIEKETAVVRKRRGILILLGEEREYDLPYARLEGMVRILFSPTHMSRRPVCFGDRDRDRELSCKEGKGSKRKCCMFTSSRNLDMRLTLLPSLNHLTFTDYTRRKDIVVFSQSPSSEIKRYRFGLLVNSNGRFRVLELSNSLPLSAKVPV